MLRLAVLMLLTVSFPQFTQAKNLEDSLNQEWLGMWVLLKQEAYSNCNGFYSNNDVLGNRLSSKGRHAFSPGELGKIASIKVKRSRILVLIDIEEPILESRSEGPFTLFQESFCKVELRFDFEKSILRKGDPSPISQAFKGIIVAFPSMDSAQASEVYNQRECEPFPEDYDLTLQEYEAWKLAQHFAKVQAKRDDASREMERILSRVEDSSEYGLGFVNGIKAMKRHSFPNCDQLIHTYPERFVKAPGSSESNDYKRGYEDGQKLAFHQELVYRLKDCLN